MCDVILEMVGGVAIFVLLKTWSGQVGENIREIGKKGKLGSFKINKIINI